MMRIQTLAEPMVVFAVDRNWPGGVSCRTERDEHPMGAKP
jgi:hypothetical protein